MHNRGIVLKGTKTSFGISKIPPHYVLGDDFVQQMSSTKLDEKLSLAFGPVRGTVAERLQKGLGWMIRGRISDDSTERLLFFFTAAEALLSDNDKNAPVVQNIARRGAVLLTEDIQKRIDLTKELQRLYGVRSDFVHRGIRGVHHFEARSVQQMVEAMYRAVLNKADLAQPTSGFHASLTNAGFGLPWP
jgi:hypothetical protein